MRTKICKICENITECDELDYCDDCRLVFVRTLDHSLMKPMYVFRMADALLHTNHAGRATNPRVIKSAEKRRANAALDIVSVMKGYR